MRKFTKLMLTLALLVVGVGGTKATETKVHECDYTEKDSYPWYRMGAPEGSSFDVSGGLLVITNDRVQEQNYSVQPFVDDGISTIYGYNYKVRFTLKCTAAGSLTCNMGTWGAGRSASFDVTSTDDFVTKEVSLNDFPVSATNVHILLQSGKFVGTIYLKKVEVILVENAPTRTTTVSKEVAATTGSTFSDVPYYASIVTNTVPDLVFKIPFTDKTWEKLIVEFVEAPGGDFVFVQAAGNYDSWTAISKTDLSTTLNLTSRTHWDNIALQAGDGDAFPRTTKIKRIYFSKGADASLETEDIDFKSIPGSSNTPTIKTTKGATASGDKAFEITDVDVNDYEDLVLTFSSPTVGTWTVTYDGTSENIPAGSTTYTVDVSGLSTISTLSLSVGAGDFPRFNNFEKLTLEKSTTKTMDALANDAIFSFEDATNYDEDTKTFSSNGGWTFDTPVDISDYKYLFITTAQSFDKDHSIQVTITDDNGKSIGGGSYKWEDSGIRGGCMYLDNWNHKNVLCLNLQYLEEGLDVDITKIKSLKFGGNVIVNNVVLSNYASSEFVVDGTDQYHTYSTGDYQRSYEAAGLGKFGTICLPYKAISAGAFIYQIASKSASSISLERVDGILEAGKPYFYKATDDRYVTGDPAVNKPNVNFYRVDWTGSVAAPISNNGLIGTFSEMKAPLNSYVLSSNKLYQVDAADAVTVGANKAYVDLTAITPSLARGNVFIDFDEPTGIKTVKGSEEMSKESVFFDLQGRRVAQPVKGMYIVNGKKVMVK